MVHSEWPSTPLCTAVFQFYTSVLKWHLKATVDQEALMCEKPSRELMSKYLQCKHLDITESNSSNRNHIKATAVWYGYFKWVKH